MPPSQPVVTVSDPVQVCTDHRSSLLPLPTTCHPPSTTISVTPQPWHPSSSRGYFPAAPSLRSPHSEQSSQRTSPPILLISEVPESLSLPDEPWIWPCGQPSIPEVTSKSESTISAESRSGDPAAHPEVPTSVTAVLSSSQHLMAPTLPCVSSSRPPGLFPRALLLQSFVLL